MKRLLHTSTILSMLLLMYVFVGIPSASLAAVPANITPSPQPATRVPNTAVPNTAVPNTPVPNTPVSTTAPKPTDVPATPQSTQVPPTRTPRPHKEHNHDDTPTPTPMVPAPTEPLTEMPTSTPAPTTPPEPTVPAPTARPATPRATAVPHIRPVKLPVTGGDPARTGAIGGLFVGAGLLLSGGAYLRWRSRRTSA